MLTIHPAGDELGAAPGPRELASSPYSLLASAMAGRSVQVRLGTTGLAYTDGESIHLPDDDDEYATLLRLVIQGALLGAQSLEPHLVLKLIGRATPARKYLTLEVARAVRGVDLPAPRWVRDALDGHWSGAMPATADESLHRALNGERIPEAPEVYGTIRARKLLGTSGVGLTSKLTRKDLKGKAQQEEVDELDDDEDSEESKILKLFSSPFNFENPLFKMLRNQLGMGRRPKAEGDDGGGMEMPVAGVTPVSKVGPNAVLVADPNELATRVETTVTGDLLYPEWDGYRGEYRPGWCRVGEFLPAPGGEQTELAPQLDYGLRRKLASLGLAFARHSHQAEGDGLDVGALVEFAVSKALGETPDDHVYQARLRTAHDLGVVVLLDASGSTTTATQGAPIWNEHCQLAANLVSSLEAVGDRVAAYGFNSRGRQSVRFLLVKDFDGRFDHAAVRRLASIEPAGFTRLGAAIRHASRLVETKAGTGHRLLVVVSDGFAYDDGYQGGYAERDTRKALDEAVSKGIGCVCVSVGTGTDHATLERLWGSVTHVSLSESGDLSKHIVPMIRTALKATTATGDQRTKGMGG